MLFITTARSLACILNGAIWQLYICYNDIRAILSDFYYNAYILIVGRLPLKKNGMIHDFHGSLRSFMSV